MTESALATADALSDRLAELEREGQALRARLERLYVESARLVHARETLEMNGPARLARALRGAVSPTRETVRERVRKLMSALRAARGHAQADPHHSEPDLAEQLRRTLISAKPAPAARVLHFSKEFSKPSETFTYLLIRGLDARTSFDNHVMFFERELSSERPYEKVVHLRGHGRAGLESGSKEFLAATREVLSALRPALVHCHFGWMGVPFVRVLRGLGSELPVVISFHGSDVNLWPRKYAWYKAQLKELARDRRVHGITHTETYRERLVALGLPRERIAVIPNAFAASFAEVERPSFEPRSHLSVLSVARMDVWKGHEHLIAGFSQLLTRYPQASLTLVGYGPCEPALRAQVSALRLDGRVRFYGRTAHHEVAALLRCHDVYVQPSIVHPETHQEEGQPVAVLEAIASGMPVIVTATGGMPETVQVGDPEGSAWLVPPADPHALCEALFAVASTHVDPARRAQYRRIICENHSEARQVAATAALYRRALAMDAGTTALEPPVAVAGEEW